MSYDDLINEDERIVQDSIRETGDHTQRSVVGSWVYVGGHVMSVSCLVMGVSGRVTSASGWSGGGCFRVVAGVTKWSGRGCDW